MEATNDQKAWQAAYEENLAIATARPWAERVAWTQTNLPGPRTHLWSAQTLKFSRGTCKPGTYGRKPEPMKPGQFGFGR